MSYPSTSVEVQYRINNLDEEGRISLLEVSLLRISASGKGRRRALTIDKVYKNADFSDIR